MFLFPNLKSNFFKKIDWTLLVVVFFLIFFGLAAIYSVALGRGTGEYLNFDKQLIWLAVGTIVMLIVSFLDYHLWQKIGWLGYFVSIILLILVLTPLGSTIKGSSGWFDLGFFSFQPVEFAKFFLIIVMADVCSRYTRNLHKFSQLIFMGVIVLIPLGLAVLQPDFGSGMMLFFIWLASFFLIVKNKWHVIIIISVIVLLALGSWFFILHGYQQDRIKTFIDPSLDPLGRGYNVQQSVIAVGAGRLMGKGLGFGSQSQLKFIPESQTDFVFAVIAEEMGLLGVALVLVFFMIIFYRLSAVARRAPDDFAMFLCLLIASLLFVHVFINVGMCLGLLPVTGISLPLVSYGGSFLITVMILFGLVFSINRSSVICRKS
ncbi:MAG: rod shape-determining protein RodA [Patescibacteria group bacterium]